MKTGRSPHILDLRPKAPEVAVAEPARAPHPVRQREAPPPAERLAKPPAAPLPPPKKRHRKLGKRRLLVQALKLAVVLIGAAGFLLLEIPLPERLIGIYFVTSIVYAFDSQRTFIVALIFLVLVAGASAAGQSVPAQNYAVYAFYFLVIGLVAAIREQVSNRLETDRGNSQLSD
jgi:hypothetical protein